MIKNLAGGTTISYGSALPDTVSASDGTLFFKTGTDSGLYVYGFVQDADATVPGDQSVQRWSRVETVGIYLKTSGDTMRGDLAMGSAALTISTNNLSAVTAASPMTFAGDSFVWKKAAESGGGNLMRINNGTLQVWMDGEWRTVWHSGNDGPGSGVNADLLGGYTADFFRDASNLNRGTLSADRLPYRAVQQGGEVAVTITPASQLLLNVGTTNYGGTWPININGNSATSNYASTAGIANSLNGRIGADQLPQLIEVSRALTATTAATSIDIASGDFATIFELRLSANTSVTFLNLPAAVSRGFTWTLVVTNDATAARSLTFGHPIKWAGGQIPNRTTAANAVDMYTFIKIGTVIYGSLSILDAR